MSTRDLLRECAKVLRATRPFLIDGRPQADAYLVLERVEKVLDRADPEWRFEEDAVFPEV
jgi:hypothetical protein